MGKLKKGCKKRLPIGNPFLIMHNFYKKIILLHLELFSLGEVVGIVSGIIPSVYLNDRSEECFKLLKEALDETDDVVDDCLDIH